MKYPCENCIIDPICIEACPNFKDYISKVFVSDFNSIFTYTSARSKRIYNLAKNNVEYFIYFSSLLKRKDMEEKKNGIPL